MRASSVCSLTDTQPVCLFPTQVVCEVHDVDGRKERINQIISVQGKFDQIIWEKPKWAEGSEMNNWMAYAKRKEDREIASEREWSG